MAYRLKPIPQSDRVMLQIPIEEAPDARLLGCTWDRVAQSWWIPRDSVGATPFVHHWMQPEEPLKASTRKAYKLLERGNRQALKHRSRRERKQVRIPNQKRQDVRFKPATIFRFDAATKMAR